MSINELIKYLICADCHSEDMLSLTIFKVGEKNEISEGVVWCKCCLSWYPIESGLLEFLPKELAYAEDRKQFWIKYKESMKEISLVPHVKKGDLSVTQQFQQQEHFDWYAANLTQSYTEFSESPFWKASDEIVMSEWKKQIRPGSKVLEVGCAQGRCSFNFINHNSTFVGFDISKKLVRQALDRSKEDKVDSRCVFFAADGSEIPFRKDTFDYVLIYGVLHHLPNPRRTCGQVERVLKDGGVYFGHENNKTFFRLIFDFLQKIYPIWHEEAGPEFMISKNTLKEGFSKNINIKTKSHVYLPPHFINIFKSSKIAKRLLDITDKVCRSIPILSQNGGILLIEVRKRSN